jgi:hypothetical protein
MYLCLPCDRVHARGLNTHIYGNVYNQLCMFVCMHECMFACARERHWARAVGGKWRQVPQCMCRVCMYVCMNTTHNYIHKHTYIHIYRRQHQSKKTGSSRACIHCCYRETERQTDKQTHRHIVWQTETARRTDRQDRRNRLRHRQTKADKDRQTDRQSRVPRDSPCTQAGRRRSRLLLQRYLAGSMAAGCLAIPCMQDITHVLVGSSPRHVATCLYA